MCRLAHIEWPGELGDGCLSGGQAREDGAPGRIGEGGKGGIEKQASVHIIP